jgi:VanZ family protein
VSMVDLEPQVQLIEGPALARRRRLFRLAFWIYAAILFTGTHWPRLTMPGPEGSDKVIHIGAFGTWMLLATACGWFARPLSDRNILRSLLLAAAYAGTDEGLQAIPFVHRTAALDDYAANCIGIMLAALSLLILRHRLEKRSSADPEQ